MVGVRGKRYQVKDGGIKRWLVIDTKKLPGDLEHVCAVRLTRDDARLKADFLNTYRSDAE